MRQFSSPTLGGLGWVSRTAYGAEHSHRPEEDEEEGDAGRPHRHQHSPHEDDVGPAPCADVRLLHEGVGHRWQIQGLARSQAEGRLTRLQLPVRGSLRHEADC